MYIDIQIKNEPENKHSNAYIDSYPEWNLLLNYIKVSNSIHDLRELDITLIPADIKEFLEV